MDFDLEKMEDEIKVEKEVKPVDDGFDIFLSDVENSGDEKKEKKRKKDRRRSRSKDRNDRKRSRSREPRRSDKDRTKGL